MHPPAPYQSSVNVTPLRALARTKVKALKMTETRPPVVRTIVCAQREKTQAARQCIIEAQTAMSMEVQHSHVLRGVAKGGRTVTSIPKIPSPAPTHRKNLIFIDQKPCCCHNGVAHRCAAGRREAEGQTENWDRDVVQGPTAAD